MRAPLVNFRRMQVATPWPLVWAVTLFWLFTRLVGLVLRMGWVAVKHWRAWPLVAVLLVAADVYGDHGWWPHALVLTVTAVVMGAWWRLAPASFHRFVFLPLLAVWRKRWVYRRQWVETMTLSGLVRKYDGGVMVPRLLSVRCTSAADHVVLRMPRGQNPDDWYKAKANLAYSFGSRHCRVYSSRRAVAPSRTGRLAWLLRLVDRVVYRDQPRHMTLVFLRRDALTQLVKPFRVPFLPDLHALPLGLREDLATYTLRLHATHVLIGGATQAGKGSVIWSLVRSLAGGVEAGMVQLWVIDPKGGMELFMGHPMFTRYEDSDFPRMADMFDDAITRMRERQARLRGVVRTHQPTVSDPLIVIVIDELANLLAYLQDNDLKARLTQSLALLLSQGAALGVLVVGATQDPRKEVVSLRDLFPTRIALRLNETNHVDLILGEGARNRGALCDQITDAPTGKGVGYVLLDGQAEPARVRFSYIDDDLIRDMAATYPALAPATTPLDVPATADDEPRWEPPRPVNTNGARTGHVYRPTPKQAAAPLLPPSLLAALDPTSPNGGDQA